MIASSREVDASRELRGGPFKGRQRLVIGSRLSRGVADAPMDRLRRARELGTDLAHAVTEADHVVETLVYELAEVLGAAAGDVESAVAHHPQRVGMQRLGIAAGAGRAHRAGRELLGERLRHLGAGAVARAQKQHTRRASHHAARTPA